MGCLRNMRAPETEDLMFDRFEAVSFTSIPVVVDDIDSSHLEFSSLSVHSELEAFVFISVIFPGYSFL